MTQIDNHLKSIIDYQLVYGSFSNDQSLLNGRMGLSLFFFQCARLADNRFYKDAGEELLEDVCTHLTFDLAIDFADGLCGIGWAIEYMVRSGFVEGDTDEILEEIDVKVMERDLRRITDSSLEHGLEGIAAYVRSRLDSPARKSGKQPFDTCYIEDFKNACKHLHIDWQSEDYTPEAIWQRSIAWWNQTADTAEGNSWKRGMALLNSDL